MNNKKSKATFVIIAIIFSSVVFLCGCSENNNSNEKNVAHTEFLGIWTGNMNYSSNTDFSRFNFPENANFTNMTNMTRMQNFRPANITKLEFREDTVDITITTDNDTMIISNSYTVEGNQLILSMQFTGQRPDGMQPPDNWERPSDGGGNPPDLGDTPPDNTGRPMNGDFPSNKERPSRTNSYAYNFNEDKTILYLNGSEFTKVS